jgi:uncharacterized protein (DUF2336 family)
MVAFLLQQEAAEAGAIASTTGLSVLVASLLVTLAWIWYLYR